MVKPKSKSCASRRRIYLMKLGNSSQGTSADLRIADPGHFAVKGVLGSGVVATSSCSCVRKGEGTDAEEG